MSFFVKKICCPFLLCLLKFVHFPCLDKQTIKESSFQFTVNNIKGYNNALIKIKTEIQNTNL